MKTRLVAMLALCFALVCSAVVVSAAATAPKDAKCPVSGKNCNPEKHADFAGGKVYFCCDNCAGAFKADSAKFAAKAHHQLVSTGQLVQKACPLSGGPCKAGTEVDVAGVSVSFCCNNCKGKVEAAKGDEQVNLVFGNISKGFEAKK